METAKASVQTFAVRSMGFSGQTVPMRRPPWLPERAWPFKTSTLAVNGRNIAYSDVGFGPVLLFVHTGLWSFSWRDVILQLSREFRCVCFDAPGTGQSDRLPILEISLANAADAVVSIGRCSQSWAAPR
jgi:haloalkane dehalogenase